MHENLRAQRLPASATLALAARAKALKAAGHDILSMAVGEPDFNAPKAAQEAAIRAVGSGEVRYTPAAGLPSLRATIAQHIERTRGVPLQAERIVVGHSCKHMLAATMDVLLEKDDEVLLFEPAWNSYQAQIEFAGGKAVWVPCESDLSTDPARIRAAIGPRTKGMLLNSPSNPAGIVWTRDQIEALAQMAIEHDLWILSDEIYSRLTYPGSDWVSPLALGPEVAERTIVVDGASKTFAMTGYRIGYAAAPLPIAKALGRLVSQTTGCPNVISQMAYQAVLQEEPPEVAAMLQAFHKRRDVLIPGLRELGLDVPTPGGAFYAFPDISSVLRGRSTEAFCAQLLEEQHLAVVPGEVFGSPSRVRMSYALPEADLLRALERLKTFLKA